MNPVARRSLLVVSIAVGVTLQIALGRLWMGAYLWVVFFLALGMGLDPKRSPSEVETLIFVTWFPVEALALLLPSFLAYLLSLRQAAALVVVLIVGCLILLVLLLRFFGVELLPFL